MARKRQQRQRKAAAQPRSTAQAAGSAEDRVIDSALSLAESRGWRGITLADIATEAGVTLAQLYGMFPSKRAVLSAYLRRVDRATLEGVEIGAQDGSIRDRLFDIFMRRFDALEPHKRAVASIAADLPRHPLAALCAGARLCQSVAWMAGAAGVDTGGPLGPLRVQALAALYASVLRTWLGDDSEDHAKTMAALDRALKRAEMLAQSFPFARRRAAAEAE